MSIEDAAVRTNGAMPPRPRRERRTHRRKATLWEGRLDSDAGVVPCVVLNVSPGGAMLRVEAPLVKSGRATLMIERLGALAAEIVWQLPEQAKMGLRFTDPPERVARILGDSVPL